MASREVSACSGQNIVEHTHFHVLIESRTHGRTARDTTTAQLSLQGCHDRHKADFSISCNGHLLDIFLLVSEMANVVRHSLSFWPWGFFFLYVKDVGLFCGRMCEGIIKPPALFTALCSSRKCQEVPHK